jgi:hypothetical protein
MRLFLMMIFGDGLSRFGFSGSSFIISKNLALNSAYLIASKDELAVANKE